MRELLANPVFKTIAGSIARHWLGAFLGLMAGKLIPREVLSTVPMLTDDMVANGLIALGAAVIPSAASIWTRLKLLLRVRLGLRMHAGMTETNLDNVIAEATPGARLAAIVTSDPLKL
jgi:hypothetical protein